MLVDDDRHVELLGLHLAQQLGDALRLRHEVRGPQHLAHRLVALAAPAARHEVLQEHEADDVVGRLVVRGQARLPGRDRDADRFVDGRVGVDRDHVGPRHHHLAHDRVAELEDRVDELALLGLDRRLLRGDVGHREDLLLGDERPAAQPLAREHDVGEPDEAAREEAQRRELREERRAGADTDITARSACCTANVFGATSANVNTTMISITMPDDDAGGAEARLEHGAEQRRRDHLAREQHEQHAVQRLLGMLEQAQHALGALVALVGEVQQPDPARAHERGLRQREHGREREQHHDHRDRDGVTVHTWPQDLCSSSRKRARSSCSRRRITTASLGFGVVVVEQVQHTVDDEQRQLVFGADAALRSPGGSRPPGTPPRRRAASADRSDRRWCPGPRPP